MHKDLQQKVRRKIGCSKDTINKKLQEPQITRKRRKKRSLVGEGQAIAQKQRLKNLAKRTFRGRSEITVIMDNETYFTLDGIKWQPHNFY